MLTDFCKPMLGGIEQHVFSLSRLLVEKGHQVIIGTIKQNALKSIEVYDGICIQRLNSLFQKVPFLYSNPAKKYHPPFQDFLLVKEIENLINNFKPDIIHCHGWVLFSCLPLKSKYNIPIITTLHHYGFLCPKQDLFFNNEYVCNTPFSINCYSCSTKSYGFLTSIFLSALVSLGKKDFSEIDKFIAVSDFVKNIYFQNLNLPENQIITIPNFCELENEIITDSAGLPSEFILYVGQLVPYKGIDFLLSAYAASEIDLPLLLIGGKHLPYDYKRFDDGRKIIVRENAPRDLVLSALKQCSFLVAPSIWADPCPTTVLEAMSFGKAVIGSKYGGIPEMVIHEKTGYIIDPKNTQDFAKYLKLLSTSLQLQKTMGTAGKMHFLNHFTAGHVVKAIEHIYDEAFENGCF